MVASLSFIHYVLSLPVSLIVSVVHHNVDHCTNMGNSPSVQQLLKTNLKTAISRIALQRNKKMNLTKVQVCRCDGDGGMMCVRLTI